MSDRHITRLSNIDIHPGHSLYLHYKSYHDDLFKAFGQFAKGSLMDIGCGNKPYEAVLSPYITNYYGCDIVQSDNNRVDLLCPANNIPVNDNAFDTVISTQTIEHVEDPQGLINEAYRICNKNGCLIISGPMYWPLHEEPYDFFRYTKHGFRYMLEKAGFKIVQINSNGGKWSVAGQALIHAIYPTIYNMKGIKGHIARGINWLFGGVSTLNRGFYFLDKKVPDYTNTMNYVIVAQKL